jgi:putative phosphoesterase
MASSVVGVISDTHGLLRPEAVAALADVSHIIHAGDIGSSEILERLAEIAPVTAVRGNNDAGPWAKEIPETAELVVGKRRLYVVHDIAELDIDPGAAMIAVVITGHSHKASSARRDGVLYLNPGSAGPRRFKLPVTLAKLYVTATSLRTRFYTLRV